MKERTMLRRAPLFAVGSLVGAGRAVFALLGRTASTDGNVAVLTDENFDKAVNGSIPALVEFYAPWCGHCKKLAPVYEQLGDAFAHARESVLIAKVDADEHGALRSRFGIQGYPTLKWFAKGVTNDPVNYSGGRELRELIDYVESATGIRAMTPQEPKNAVTVLRSSNFDKVALDNSKDVLVEFYAPWCGHCKELAPIYNKVAAAFENEPNCVVANLDATESKDIAEKYNIESYPTVKFFPKGEKGSPVDYDGGRDEKDFINFLNERCGTHRTPGGGLLEIAGRLAIFDTIARQFSEATNNENREAFYNQAKELAEGWVLSANSSDGLAKAAHDASDTAIGKAKAADLAGAKVDQAKAKAGEIAEGAKSVAKAAKERITDAAKEATDAVNDLKAAGVEKEEVSGNLDKSKDWVRTEADAVAGKISQKAGDAAGLLQHERDAVEETASGAIDDARQAIDAAKVKYAQYYVRVMEKINEQGDYVEKELARLRKIVSSGSVPPQKLDDFLTRQNILGAFRKITGDAPELANRHEEL